MVNVVLTKKFSEFVVGGDLPNNAITVGLGNNANTQYNNPWTFLAPGTTAERPVPSAAIFDRLRFNTTLNVYEYYDTVSAMWVQLSGSGTGTVNPGAANNLAYYAANGTAVSALSTANNSILATNNAGVPSLVTTLPSGLSIPGAIITSSTASLLSGQVAAAPTNPTDITNKNYVDTKFSSGVTSITGTTNQVIASSSTGAVTLSLPQDIATGSSPTFNILTLNSLTLNAQATNLSMNSHLITNLLNPVSAQDAATKSYVDSIASGITVQGACYAGTTANLAGYTYNNGSSGVGATLTAGSNGAFSTDGVSPALNARILVKNQSTQSQNGIYTLTTVGTVSTPAVLTRATDYDLVSQINPGDLVVITNGTTLTSSSWLETATVITIGTDPIIFAQFTASLPIPVAFGGTGLTTVAANQMLVGSGTNTYTLINSVNNSVLQTNGSGVPSFSTTLPAGLTIPTPKINQINDNNGVDILSFTTTASAVNNFNINNAIAGSAPSLSAIGADTDISIIMNCKNSGFLQVNSTSNSPLKLFSGTSSQHQTVFNFANTANTRNVTFPDSDGTVLFTAGSGGLKSFTVLPSGTAATYTKPVGITSLLVEVLGGGGAGGGAAGGAGTVASGSGGGAGGYARLWIPSAASTYTYTVGTGGTGVSGGNGGNGNTTSFGASLQATGGTGGLVMTATSGILFRTGSAGGVGSNGDINFTGGPGATSLAVNGNPASGNGGSSHYGGGAVGLAGTGAGNNASVYGAGGSGSVAGAANTAGGNGSAGVIIVWEFA